MTRGPGRPTGPTVYLHVGEPKTGTTFLQQVMWSNRSELAHQGVLLPGHRLQDHFRANQDLREAPQAANDPAGSWTGEWDLLARQTLQARCTAVISHELLAGASAEQAGRAVASLAPAEVHVVVTVRDLATLLPAEWQETVKHRNTRGWETWLADVIDRREEPPDQGQGWFWRVHDTLDLLARWAGHVPADRVHVVTVPPRGSAPGLLWERFATLLGVDPASVDTSRARPNASLGMPEVELLRRVNQALPQEIPGWFYAPHVKETLAHQTLAGRPRTGRLLLPPDREEWAAKQAELLVNGLRDAGFGIVGDLDDLRPVPATGNGAHPDEATAEEMLDAAVSSVVALLRSQYRRAHPQPRPQGGLVSQGRAAVESSAWVKRTVRRLSNDHASVRRLRVLSWRLAERARARRGRE